MDTGEHPAGEVFQVDAHPFAAGEQPGALGQGIEQFALVLFAVGGDLGSQEW